MSLKLPSDLKTKLHKKLIEEESDILSRSEELKVDDPFSNPDHVSDNAAIDTDVREQMGHDRIEAQILALQKRLAQVRAALKKMSKDEYGQCENCKKSIPLARLQLVPEARFCVECEKKFVK